MKKFHKPKVSIVLASLWLAFVFLSAEALARDRHEEKFEKTEALAKDGKVFLSNVSGDVEVRTWDKDEVKIDALKVSEASSLSQAKENCGLVTIEVTKEAGLLRIETKYPHQKTFWGGNSINVSVDYKLWIPAKASAEVKSVSGDVELEAIGGAVKAGVVSGSVTLKKAAAGADLNTVSGELTLEDITGNVYLKTVSGDIDVTRIKGSIEAETVSGGIEMREVTEAGSISAKIAERQCRLPRQDRPPGALHPQVPFRRHHDDHSRGLRVRVRRRDLQRRHRFGLSDRGVREGVLPRTARRRQQGRGRPPALDFQRQYRPEKKLNAKIPG